MAMAGSVRIYSTPEVLEELEIQRPSLYRYCAELGDVPRNERGDFVFTDAVIARLKNLKIERTQRKIRKKGANRK